MSDPRQLTAGGWALAVARGQGDGAEAVATTGPEPATPAIGAPRGILGAVAQGIDNSGPEAVASPKRAARLALWGLVEGFFSARPTLGQGRAAAQALNAINSWMFATQGAEGLEPGLAASLSAIVFSGTRAGLVQVGSGMILRLRQGELSRLIGPQLRRGASAALQPRRFLGADSRLLLDFLEDAAQTGDRYILVSDMRGRPDFPDVAALCRTHADAADLAARLSGSRAALVIDVIGVPEPTQSTLAVAASEFPLGPIPHDGDNRDGYLIGRTLHRGAYTLVKRATDTRDGQPVVLKFPLPAMLNDRVFQAGFAREAWIGAAVHSAVVGRVIIPEPGRQSSLYIVMPYYKGETLEARIARDPRFTVAEVVSITLQLCQAVEDLRALQILHRDLKPENVLLLAGGDLRLLDLGLAYVAQVEQSEGNGLGGTLIYMAPELLRGGVPNDTTEVYALGVLMHRLVAFGRFPRPNASVATTLARLRPDLPVSLRDRIQAALNPDPTKRPAHAALLAEGLGRVLEEGDIGEPPPARSARDPATFWRVATAVLALAVLALIALRQ